MNSWMAIALYRYGNEQHENVNSETFVWWWCLRSKDTSTSEHNKHHNNGHENTKGSEDAKIQMKMSRPNTDLVHFAFHRKSTFSRRSSRFCSWHQTWTVELVKYSLVKVKWRCVENLPDTTIDWNKTEIVGTFILIIAGSCFWCINCIQAMSGNTFCFQTACPFKMTPFLAKVARRASHAPYIPTVTCTLPIPILGIFVFPFPWESHSHAHLYCTVGCRHTVWRRTVNICWRQWHRLWYWSIIQLSMQLINIICRKYPSWIGKTQWSGKTPITTEKPTITKHQ